MPSATMEPTLRKAPPEPRVCHMRPLNPLCGAEPNEDADKPHEVLKCLMAGHKICVDCESVYNQRG